MSHAIAVQHGDFGRAALYRLDRPISLHAHREGHLIFLVDGPDDGAVEVCGAIRPLSPRRAVAVSPWEPHRFIAPRRGPGLYLTLYIKPFWFLEAGRSAKYALSFGRTRIDVAGRIAELAPRLTSLLLADEPAETFPEQLYELTRACFDQSWQWTPGASPLAEAHARFTDHRVRRSLRLMRERLHDEDGIDQIAAESGLSRPHFYKLFRKQMGITPNLYLNTLKTEAAIDDLLGTEKTVTDISHELGFASQASFTRFFTCNVGIAPSEYRRVAQAELV
ncbi:MAG: AraC family transcriptional regulator [Pseudomonadota bacterium]